MKDTTSSGGWKCLASNLPIAEFRLTNEMMPAYGIKGGYTCWFRTRGHNRRGWGPWSETFGLEVPILRERLSKEKVLKKRK